MKNIYSKLNNNINNIDFYYTIKNNKKIVIL